MLARFERLMEQAVEGSLRRVFPTPLQPVQLAKAAARAMEQGQVIGVRGAEVPNHYELRLAPADLERFGEYAGALPEQVCSYLLDYAGERELRPVAEMRVELLPDSTVRMGSVVARARFANLAPATQREVDVAVEGTRRLRLAELAAAQTRGPSAKQRQLWLTDTAGLRFALEPQAGIVRLGRATDNDVVIDSEHISRYHAQLRWVESTWLIYDLGSTNGTWVDDQRLRDRQARAVEVGKRLRLGDHELKVRAGTG
jgi:hypothetical protein